MTPRWLLQLVAILSLVGRPTAVEAQTPVPRLAIEDSAESPALAAIESAGPLPFPVAVRIVVSLMGGENAAADPRLASLAARRVPLWLVVDAPRAQTELDAWRQGLQSLLSQHADALSVLEIRVADQPEAVARFAVQVASTEAGARGRAIRIALGGRAMDDASRRETIYSDALVPYVGLLVVPAERLSDVGAWLDARALQADLAVLPSVTGGSTDASLLEATLAEAGSRVAIHAWHPAEATAATLRALAQVSGLLTHRVVTIDAVQVSLATSGGGTDARVRQRLLFDTDTFATYFAYWGVRADEPMIAELGITTGGPPRLFDLSAGTVTRLSDAVSDTATGRVRVRLPLTGGPMLLAFNDEGPRFGDRSDASAERELSVGEIIARHQQQQRAQDATVTHYVAHARMEHHFRPTIADPGYDVVSENTYFAGPDGVEWAEISFSVNGSKWGADRPPFPLLQPEKVLSLPLLLRFDEGYTYRLAGEERIRDFDCYVVRFDPVRDDASLYRGTVWIDRQTFARVRVQAVRSHLSPPIISNDETLEYTVATTLDGQPIFLFTRLDARQILLVAGRNLLVEKRVVFSDFQINDPQFAASREAARDSEAIMFRETPDGLRDYVKEDGRRVVREEPNRDLTALAVGVTIDPAYSFPLPIFGINYLNFHFKNPDAQLAILFAGVLAAGNIQRSNFGAKGVDASVDFFAIAVPSSDRVYGPHGEDPSARLLTWPLSTGVNIGWQATPFQKATLQYQFRFDGFIADRTTSAEFVTPSSTVTNGIGGAWEYRRGGYSLISNAAWFRRASWRPWGTGVETSPTFVKYTAALSRDFYLDAFQKLHLNGSWFGSHDADRFAKYQFGMFEDTRIHGVPSSGVRYAELAMARGAYSFNIFEQYRVDIFLEHGWGRDEAGQGSWDGIPAVGLALNLRGPWDTILRVDAGKSWLPPQFDGLRSATLQVMLLKPLQ